MISKILCNNIHYKFKNSTFHSANLAGNNKKQILYCLKTTNFTSTVFSSWLPWKHNGSSENLVIKMYIQSTRCLALLVPLLDPCLIIEFELLKGAIIQETRFHTDWSLTDSKLICRADFLNMYNAGSFA